LILYGYVHKEKPIMLAYVLWLIVNSGVAIAAIAYS